MSFSHPMSCVLPEEQPRARGLGHHHGGPVRCQLPAEARRRRAMAAQAQAAGGPARVAMPMEYRRQPAKAQSSGGAPARVAYPMEAHRSPSQRDPQTSGKGSPQPPMSRPDPVSPLPASPADQGRAKLSVAAMLPIVEIVARGISGAAGYAYVGEDPDVAGVRFGMLGQRLDTGDMGRVLALAQARDPAAFAACFGADSDALLSITQAADPAGRKEAINGAELWSAAWKPRLNAAGAKPSFAAAQNEYAVESQLRPAAELILGHPPLVSGAALGMALDVLAECGRDAGLEKLSAALANGGAESLPGLQAALAKAVPVFGRRLPFLAKSEPLLNWRPDPAQGLAA